MGDRYVIVKDPERDFWCKRRPGLGKFAESAMPK